MPLGLGALAYAPYWASCSIYYNPNGVGGCAGDLSVHIGGYGSESDRGREIQRLPTSGFPTMAYATLTSSNGAAWLVAAKACVEDPDSALLARAPKQLAPLKQFGFSVFSGGA